MEISVTEAAARLGVDPSRVRQLARSGRLPARIVGRQWLVQSEPVVQLAQGRRPPGRPLSARRAWALLDILDGGSGDWLTPSARSQVRRARRTLASADADKWRSALSGRHVVERVYAHPAALRRLLEVDDGSVLPAGPAEAVRAGLDLVVAGAAVREVHVRPEAWPGLARRLSLAPAAADANLVVHLPRDVWPFADRVVPGPSALAADLLDSPESRARAAGFAHLSEAATSAVGAP